jgi:hypothetical protein
MLKRAAGACASLFLCALAGTALADDVRAPFSLPSFERDPAAYVAARYPAATAAIDLRADLETLGFTCSEIGARADIVACERLSRMPAQCSTLWRIEKADPSRAPNVLRGRRCRGQIPVRTRAAGYGRALFRAADAQLLGGLRD